MAQKKVKLNQIEDIQASDITDFDTEVSNNVDVAANTAARHDPVTVTDTPTVNLSLLGQDLQANVVPGGISHNDLASLQGGAAGQYNHLTNAESALVSNITTNSNQIYFSDGTDVVQSADLTFDDTNDFLSIGKATPGSLIDAETSSANAILTLNPKATGGSNFSGITMNNEGVFGAGVYFSESSGELELYVDSLTPKVVLDSFGNLGVGTTNPGVRLEVVTAASSGQVARFVNNGSSTTNSQVSISGGVLANAALYLGSTSAPTEGGFVYENNANELTMRLGGADRLSFNVNSLVPTLSGYDLGSVSSRFDVFANRLYIYNSDFRMDNTSAPGLNSGTFSGASWYGGSTAFLGRPATWFPIRDIATGIFFRVPAY